MTKPTPPELIVAPVDASQVPRFAGLRTFARVPTLEQAGRADVAVLGAPFDGGTTFRAGSRNGPGGIREASLLLRPYNDALDVSPFAERQVVDAGDAPASSVQIGLRGSMYGPEDYADNAGLGFTTLFARDFDRGGVAGAVELALSELRPPMYITVDIDCLDPAFAPGTGTPEAGGLTSRELLAVLRGLAGAIDLAAADVVEVSPPYDPAGATAVAAAHAAYELLSLLVISLRD
jgi:arginase family enzyme